MADPGETAMVLRAAAPGCAAASERSAIADPVVALRSCPLNETGTIPVRGT